ncbi:MAG: hypothetical protein ACE5H7_17820 [Acidiferrobacterales bacterium]
MTTNYRMLDRTSGQRFLTVRASDIERIEEYDSDPDLSYSTLTPIRITPHRTLSAWQPIARVRGTTSALRLGPCSSSVSGRRP